MLFSVFPSFTHYFNRAFNRRNNYLFTPIRTVYLKSSTSFYSLSSLQRGKVIIPLVLSPYLSIFKLTLNYSKLQVIISVFLFIILNRVFNLRDNFIVTRG